MLCVHHCADRQSPVSDRPFDPAPAGAPATPSEALLDGLQQALLERLPPALERAIARVDDYLFDRSQAGDDQLGLVQLRELRQLRGRLVRGFEHALQAGFRRLRDPWLEPTAVAPLTLSLIEEAALDEQLAVEQLAESLARVHQVALEALGQRLRHLLRRDELKAADDPFAPMFLADAVRKAMQAVELDGGVRIVLLKYLEREWAPALGQAYERANAALAAAGVLPHLRIAPRHEEAARAAATPRAPEPGAPVAPDPAPAGVAAPAISPADQAAFAGLLGLLQGWRSANGWAPPAPGNGPPPRPISSAELLSVLSLLQGDLPRQQALADGSEPLALRLRQEMAQGAKRLGVAGDNLHLDGLDEDAVDLVALLFDVLLDGPQFGPEIRRMIGRMLVPYVKVAVKDRRMFLFKEHPARRLLNTVAEACEGNRGEAPQERELLNHVDHTIDRLVAEFNEDVAIFEVLEQELRAYMAQHRKRVELAERRAAEQQRGRERLEQARARAEAMLARMRSDRELPPVLDAFVGRYAVHHLVQVILREGQASPRIDATLGAVERLLLAFDHAELQMPVAQMPELPRTEILAVLASSGCLGEPAEGVLAAMQEALLRVARGEPPSAAATALDAPIPPLEPPAPPPPDPVPPGLELVAGNDMLDYDGHVLEHMRALKVGQWVQLATSPDRVEPAKVSWISPISGRLLLVNRRGIRVLVASPEELAAMAKLGKVSLRQGETPFEDALQQVAGRLKSAAAKL